MYSQQYSSFVNVMLFLCVGDVYTDVGESRWTSKFEKFVLYLKEPRKHRVLYVIIWYDLQQFRFISLLNEAANITKSY